MNTQISAAQAAVDWAGALINLDSDDVDAGLVKLRDDTVGELRDHFYVSVVPYRDALRALRSHTQGHIRSVSIESVHHNLDAPGKVAPAAPRSATVLIVATSVGDDATGAPKTIEWNLRIGVTDAGGRLLISQVEVIR